MNEIGKVAEVKEYEPISIRTALHDGYPGRMTA